MNVAIIGAGLIGRKRALALPSEVNLKLICDLDDKRSRQLSAEFGCGFERDWRKVLQDKQIDIVFICTSNNFLAEISMKAIKMGKHILVEKPGARSLKELEKVYEVFKKSNTVVQYGYNHPFHQAILKAKKIVDSKKYGPVLFIRARYGHGGRLGYEKEWRMNKDISGGGELLDQGSHLIDLVNFFCGRMGKVYGVTPRLYWDSQVEDSAFFIVSNKKGQIAHLSATCVEWKNIFCFEIMLRKAKLQIDGLGGSYGQEKLTLYKMKPEMGPPEKEEFTFEEDTSWKKEVELFFKRIKNKDYSNQSIKDAMYVLETIEKLYKQ